MDTSKNEEKMSVEEAPTFNGIIGSFIGAYPCSKPSPVLSEIPRSVNLLYLSFAREMNNDGVFTADWDLSSDNAITPERIEKDKKDNNRYYFASLAGDKNPFNPQVPRNDWIKNALSSLRQLKEKYHLDGFDVNYETIENIRFFQDVMRQMFEETSPFEFLWTVSPYAATRQIYFETIITTLRLARPLWVNYQQYASGNDSVEDNVRDLKSVIDGYDSLGKDISFGVSTDPKSPRGASPKTALKVIRELRQRGLGGAFSWAAEYSASDFKPPFKFEVEARDAFSV